MTLPAKGTFFIIYIRWQTIVQTAQQSESCSSVVILSGFGVNCQQSRHPSHAVSTCITPITFHHHSLYWSDLAPCDIERYFKMGLNGIKEEQFERWLQQASKLLDKCISLSLELLVFGTFAFAPFLIPTHQTVIYTSTIVSITKLPCSKGG